MSRALVIAGIVAVGILGGGLWVEHQIGPVPQPAQARAEQQVALLEQTAKRSGIHLHKSHEQLVAEEIAQQAEFERRMNHIKRIGDEAEAFEAQQTEARRRRQCAAGLASAC